jgi:hypothetical protein
MPESGVALQLVPEALRPLVTEIVRETLAQLEAARATLRVRATVLGLRLRHRAGRAVSVEYKGTAGVATCRLAPRVEARYSAATAGQAVPLLEYHHEARVSATTSAESPHQTC